MYVSPDIVREWLQSQMRFRTLENLAANAPHPENFKRRATEILHGRSTRVTERVADEIAITLGHPEWMQTL